MHMIPWRNDLRGTAGTQVDSDQLQTRKRWAVTHGLWRQIGWILWSAYLWRVEGHKGWVQNLTGADQAVGDANPQKASSKPHSQKL